MKTFFSLFKMSLNLNFGISALKYRFRKEKNKLWEPILIGITVSLGIGMLIAFICFLSLAIYTGGVSVGQPEAVLTLALVVSQIIILVFGIFYIMGAFYFSKDLNILIPLPLKPAQVLGSKFAVVMVNEYLTAIPVLLPALIIYGVGTGAGVLYWLKALIVLAAVPAIPLVIGAIFILILMRFINIRKSKDLLAIIGGLFGLLIAVGSNYISQSMSNVQGTEFVNKLLDKKYGITELVGSRFPPSIWATMGLSEQGLKGFTYFALFILISILLFVVLMLLGNQVFYKSILSGQEITRKRKALSEVELGRQSVKTSEPVIALFKKEWKMFIRSPIYVLNGVMGMVIGPFLVVMPFITNQQSNAALMPFIRNPEYGFPVALAGLALMIFTTNINIIASTSISREGQMFWISKMIPVSPKNQVSAKILHSLSLEIIGLVVTAVVLIVFAKIAIIRIVVLIIISLAASTLLTIVSLMIDVVRPKLEWSSPQEAVKRNINGVLGMVATMIVLVVLAALTAIMMVLNLPEILVYLLLTLIIIVLTILAAKGLFAIAEARYSKIEV